MKRVLILLVSGLLCCGPVWAGEKDDAVQACRQVVAEFSQLLQAELQSAMQQGGPAQAISVCRVKAPQIAVELTTKYNTYVRRTSLKPRNIRNTPVCWEEQVLNGFEHSHKQGVPVEDLESSAIVPADGDRELHYMKAIPTKPVCLVCHGDNIAPDVARQLHKLYPDDQALGFKVGDIRGAFSLRMPLD